MRQGLDSIKCKSKIKLVKGISGNITKKGGHCPGNQGNQGKGKINNG